MSGALVLAGPERKRHLRELLAIPEDTWTFEQRRRYRMLVRAEFQAMGGVLGDYDDETSESVEGKLIADLVLDGMPPDEAYRQAHKAVLLWRAGPDRGKGRREREQRKDFRKAVTAMDGRAAVTAALWTRYEEASVTARVNGRDVTVSRGALLVCLTCGKVLDEVVGWHRRDAAYCSNRCRQKAYRTRRKRKLLTGGVTP